MATVETNLGRYEITYDVERSCRYGWRVWYGEQSASADGCVTKLGATWAARNALRHMVRYGNKRAVVAKGRFVREVVGGDEEVPDGNG